MLSVIGMLRQLRIIPLGKRKCIEFRELGQPGGEQAFLRYMIYVP